MSRKIDSRKHKILIIAGGTVNNLSVITNINKIIKILKKLHNNVILVSYCGKNENIELNFDDVYSVPRFSSNLFDFLLAQFTILRYILKLKNQYDTILFAFGQDLLILPMIFSKIFGKKIIIRTDGRPSIILKKYFKNSSRIKIYLFEIIEKFNYSISDTVLTECEFMISENNLNKYNNINIGSLFIDEKIFNKFKPFNNREIDIGYIGRFHNEKGIAELMLAISDLILKYPDLKILLGGGGELFLPIKKEIEKKSFSDRIFIKEWITQDQLPNFLNNIKLLILPSYKEGLPNIILESMGCGTAVLATPVGGIPGVILDGKTGYIMDNNTPECIVENVKRALTSPELEEIAENGRRFVLDRFSFDNVVQNWGRILEE